MLVTPRTRLEPYHPGLAQDFIRLNTCPVNRAEMNGPHTQASALKLFETLLEGRGLYALAVLERGSGQYLGHVFVCGLPDAPELGFIFDKTHWGKGIASEALAAFWPWACDELGLGQAVATVNTGHHASMALLRGLGFAECGQGEDEFGPYLEFSYQPGRPAVENQKPGNQA